MAADMGNRLNPGAWPRSANHNSALTWDAAAIMVAPGTFTYPNNDAARMRAGVELDLAAARALRLAGNKAAARSRLEFCRAARLFAPGVAPHE